MNGYDTLAIFFICVAIVMIAGEIRRCIVEYAETKMNNVK
jgi:hypothetical protein